MTYLWIQIVEANLHELKDLKALIFGTFSESKEQYSMLAYVDCLIHFFRNDLPSLTQSSDAAAEDSQLNNEVKKLIQMRAQFKKDSVPTDELGKDQFTTDIFKGEALYIQGMAFHSKGEYVNAESKFLLAANSYLRAGALRKSLRAKFSSLAAYSCLSPEVRLFAEYQTLYKQAIKLPDFQTAATIALNVSREFQKLKADLVALDWVTQAIANFEVSSFGNREHGLALVHRANIYLEQGKQSLGIRDLQLALSLNHPDVSSSIQVLRQMFHLQSEFEFKNRTSPLETWKERQEDIESGSALNKKPLGNLAAKLVGILAKGSVERVALMNELYGEQIMIESKEARLKNLIWQVRQKFPGLIVFENNLYSIPDPKMISEKISFRKTGR